MGATGKALLRIRSVVHKCVHESYLQMIPKVIYGAMVKEIYSRADLARLSEAPEDAVVFWMRNGLLKSIVEAARKHRRFDYREVKIATLLREMRDNGLNITAISALIGRLRECLALFDSFGLSPERLYDIQDQIWRNSQDFDDPKWSDVPIDVLKKHKKLQETPSFHNSDEISDEEKRRIIFAIANYPVDRASDLWLAREFILGDGIFAAYRSSEGQWQLKAGIGDGGNDVPSPSFLALNLGLIFADLPRRED